MLQFLARIEANKSPPTVSHLQVVDELMVKVAFIMYLKIMKFFVLDVARNMTT